MVLLLARGACAGECDYGSVHAWFQASDGRWENATAHPRLHRGEEFRVKIMVSPTINLQVFFVKLHEFGTPVYEVLEGPTQIEQLFEYRQKLRPNQTFMYQWTLRIRPATYWTHGNAPLELFTQFNRNDTDECQVIFDVITAYIVDEFQGETIEEKNHENHSSQQSPNSFRPGFHYRELLTAVLVLCLFMKLKGWMFQKKILQPRAATKGNNKKNR